MTDDDSATLADVLATTPELPRPERAAAAAWARPLGRDVARALRECSSYGWLRALALELDQALALLRFGERVSLSIPERAWADDYMRKNPAPPNEARLAAVARSKSTAPPSAPRLARGSKPTSAKSGSSRRPSPTSVRSSTSPTR